MRALLLSLILLGSALGCAGTRDIEANYDPTSKTFRIKGWSNIVDGPVNADFEMRAADGSYFKGTFSANPTQQPALGARMLDFQSLAATLDLIRTVGAAYAASQGLPALPAPSSAVAPVTGTGSAPAGPASAPASAPAVPHP